MVLNPLNTAQKTLCKLFLLLFFLPVTVVSEERPVLVSGVSPSYKTGLQYKFINYLSKQSDCDTELQYLPFARRLHLLKIGKIDFLVGLSHSKEREKDIYFLNPPYYSQPIGIFTLNSVDKNIVERKKLQDFRIGTIIDSKFFPEIDQNENKLEIASVEQMVQLLLSGRIDGFIHNQKGGMMKVAEANASDRIKVMELSPPVSYDLYIGISRKSALYKDKEKLARFRELQKHYPVIRAEHYQHKKTP